MSNLIKAILSLLLLGCLLDMQYGYFQFIRIAGCIGFIYLTQQDFKTNRIITGILTLACAILLNPIFKISFTRSLWNKIDFVIAILLILWILVDVYLKVKKTNQNNSKISIKKTN